LLATFASAALQILKEHGTPLHYKAITEEAIEKKLIKASGKTPDQSMFSSLLYDIKNNRTNSKFIRLGEGVFKINPNPYIKIIPEENPLDYESNFENNNDNSFENDLDSI